MINQCDTKSENEDQQVGDVDNVADREDTREEVVVMMNNDDEAPQSHVDDHNDNVTWCQGLAESWKSYNQIEQIMITILLSVTIIIFIFIIWCFFQNFKTS